MKIVRKIVVGILIVLAVFYIFTLLTSKAALPDNPKERNKIVFQDSVLNVQDSIHTLTSYLRKFPVYNDDWISYCIVDKDVLCVNFKKIGSIDSLLKIENTPIKELPTFSKEEKVKFLKLAKYLEYNYLYRIDYYKNISFIECWYRYYVNAGDYQKDLNRFITFSELLKNLDLNKYKVLDANKSLLLYAYKNAKIWENKGK